jgi:hypothetical protein
MFSFKSKAFERFSVRFVFIVLAKGELEDQDRTGGAVFGLERTGIVTASF